MFKGLANIAQMMKQAGEMQARMGEMKQRLAEVRTQGTSRNGEVTVDATGDMHLVGCRIAPALLAAGDPSQLEALVLEAANDALSRARQAAAQQMSSVMGDAGPGFQDAMSKMGFGQ